MANRTPSRLLLAATLSAFALPAPAQAQASAAPARSTVVGQPTVAGQPGIAGQPAQARETLAPELRQAMAAAAPAEHLPAYLVMGEQLGPEALEGAMAAAGPAARSSQRVRSQAVAQALREHAASSQAAVRAVLHAAVSAGAASDVRELWIGNAIVFSATPATIERLASLPGVDRIQIVVEREAAAYQDAAPAAQPAAPTAPPPTPRAAPSPALPLVLPAAPPAAAAAQPAAPLVAGPPEPNLVALQAPALWALGVDGAGVLMGTLDSGVWWTHPDLVNRVWTNPGEIDGNGVDDDGNGKIDDVHGWDFLSNTGAVTSTFDSHGTKSAGIAVGDGSTGVRTTGMAPGATLLVCEVGSESTYWLGQQYCLEQGVSVITSSYSYKWADVPRPDYAMHRQIAAVELAAGVVHANSIGNQGQLTAGHPIPFNIATPGNCPSPFAHPDAVAGGRTSVVACGGIELPGDGLYASSGRGPAAWEDITLYDAAYPWPQDPASWDYPYGGFGGAGPGLLKPDLVAYTTDIQTTTIGGGYATFGGTSAAAPHLGGALALLRQFRPQAEPRHLAAALELTAVDLGVPGKDALYGAGKLQAFDAARRLRLLGRFDDITPALGQAVQLDLFGAPGATVTAFVGLSIADHPLHFNLVQPFLPLALFGLDGNGEASIPLSIPNDPLFGGLTVWLQLGAANADYVTWGPGPMLSVPEPLSIGS